MHPGKTRNPWNAAHTPGGSSSGSAAAVAAGHVLGGDRHADQRLDDPSRCVLRRRRFKPTPGHDSVRRACSCSARRSTRSARSRATSRAPRCSRACSPSPARIAATPAAARTAAAARRTSASFPWTTIDRDAADALDSARSTRLRHAGAEVVAVDIPAAVARRASRAADDHAARGGDATSPTLQAARARRACRATLNAALDEGRATPRATTRRRSRRARRRDRRVHRVARRLRRGALAAGAGAGARGSRRRPAIRRAARSGRCSGFPAISISDRPARRTACRSAMQLAAPPRRRRSRCSPWRAWCEARSAVRASCHEARQAPRAARRSRAIRSRARRCCARAARTARPPRRSAGRRRSNWREARAIGRANETGRVTPTSLCRTDLEQGRMREIYLAAVDAGRALNDEQLSDVAHGDARAAAEGRRLVGVRLRLAAVEPAVPGRRDARPAMLRGLHRRFCLWSLASRGTPEQPGLVLGLDRGGACRGVALRLPGAAGDRRAAPALAARDGRRRLPPALGAARRRRPRARRAGVRRPARPSAVRGPASRDEGGRA